jgi:hypothetical protein
LIRNPPFRSFPLLEDFGYCGGNYKNIQSVLDGTYKPPPGTDPYAIEFIQELEMPESTRVNRIQAACIVPISALYF